MLQYAPEEKKFWGSHFGGQLRLLFPDVIDYRKQKQHKVA